MNETLAIILPLPVRVLSPNCQVATPGGRFAKASATKRYRRITREAVEAEQIETAPWGKVVVDVVFYHKVKRRRDEDNAMGSLKAVYDGIVDSGLVPDDERRYMRRSIPEFKIDKAHPRVELFIRRIE